MNDLIDYARPMIRIEQMLKEMHNLLLAQRMDEAGEVGIYIVAEARLLCHTLTLMKEQQDALREQTQAVQKRVPAAASAKRSSKANGAATSAAGFGRQRS